MYRFYHQADPEMNFFAQKNTSGMNGLHGKLAVLLVALVQPKGIDGAWREQTARIAQLKKKKIQKVA